MFVPFRKLQPDLSRANYFRLKELFFYRKEAEDERREWHTISGEMEIQHD
jgi:hypothetical protein